MIGAPFGFPEACLFLLRRFAWFGCHERVAAGLLAFPSVLCDGPNVVPEPFGGLLTAFPNLIYDWVFTHRYAPISSAGVQMIGGSNPRERRQIPSGPRISALARCRQFHVKRMSIWWTVATAIPRIPKH